MLHSFAKVMGIMSKARHISRSNVKVHGLHGAVFQGLDRSVEMVREVRDPRLRRSTSYPEAIADGWAVRRPFVGSCLALTTRIFSMRIQKPCPRPIMHDIVASDPLK